MATSRRTFLKTTSFGLASCYLPWKLALTPSPRLHIGLCADVHKDIMHDADQRLQQFITKARRKKVDVILQMGDFCVPKEENRTFLRIWEQFEGPRFHVLGNHDTDGGFTRAQTQAFWHMPERYYSFDQGGFHVVVLDGNDPNPAPWSGYARYVNQEQQSWLKDDLARTDLPTLVFSHQSLEHEAGVANASEIRAILEAANRATTQPKVLACLSGHHHIDYATDINGIYYVQINSMSYYWLGKDYLHLRYGEAVDETHPWIKYTAPYKEALFAFVSLSSSGMTIKGVRSEFVGPKPEELGYPASPANHPISASIRNQRISFTR